MAISSALEAADSDDTASTDTTWVLEVAGAGIATNVRHLLLLLGVGDAISRPYVTLTGLAIARPVSPQIKGQPCPKSVRGAGTPGRP